MSKSLSSDQEWTLCNLSASRPDGVLSTTGDLIVNGNVTFINNSLSSMKIDLDGFNDELKALTTTEIQQLQNIDNNIISNTQWGYLQSLNQQLSTTSSPTFAGINVGELKHSAIIMKCIAYDIMPIHSAVYLRLNQNSSMPTVGVANIFDVNCYRIFGITLENAIINGAEINVALNGIISRNLGSWSVGDKLYVHYDGALTNVEPTFGRVIEIGRVLSGNKIYIFFSNIPKTIYM